MRITEKFEGGKENPQQSRRERWGGVPRERTMIFTESVLHERITRVFGAEKGVHGPHVQTQGPFVLNQRRGGGGGYVIAGAW